MDRGPDGQSVLGEFRITPAATVDMYSYFSNMYQWIASNELMGRFLFDLGQALYEGLRIIRPE